MIPVSYVRPVPPVYLDHNGSIVYPKRPGSLVFGQAKKRSHRDASWWKDGCSWARSCINMLKFKSSKALQNLKGSQHGFKLSHANLFSWLFFLQDEVSVPKVGDGQEAHSLSRQHTQASWQVGKMFLACNPKNSQLKKQERLSPSEKPMPQTYWWQHCTHQASPIRKKKTAQLGFQIALSHWGWNVWSSKSGHRSSVPAKTCSEISGTFFHWPLDIEVRKNPFWNMRSETLSPLQKGHNHRKQVR